MAQNRREIRKFIACLISFNELHWFEAEYEEIFPGVWQMVPGTLRDLGPISKEDQKRISKNK